MIYAVCNEKGGTGKSTTAAAIATGATYRGKKSLLVDLDPQGNLTYIMGGNSLDVGAYELITGQTTPGSIVQHTPQGDLITSSATLAAADSTLTGNARVYGLRDGLKPLRRRYDVIVIDTQPTLSTLVINALATADSVIIPLQPDLFCLQGLTQLLQAITDTKNEFNPGLNVAGILFTRYNGRTLVAREFTQAIKEQAAGWNIPVFNTAIREGVAVKEAQTLRKSLYEYAPKSNPAKDYLSFLDELGL